MKQKHIGILILILVVVVAVVYVFFMDNHMEDVSITGYLGGEKIGLFESEDFKKFVKNKYGLKMDYKKAGSFDMVSGDSEGEDYLFPSSQLALEVYKRQNKPYEKSEIVFNTPIVLYSRKIAVDALVKEGVVEDENGIYFVDMKKLSNMISNEVSWADIGVPEIYGNILVDTTDPNKSNSGNMFLGLLANSLSGGVVTAENVNEVLPEIKKIYNLLGYMQTSSADMFSQFLKLGVGAYPIIAGYESQILEFSKTDPEAYSKIKDDIFILYPRPTVWSSHVYISLDENGNRGLDALMDPDVQEMAWKNHGFRTVVSGTEDLTEFDVKGLNDELIQIIPMPEIDAMEILMDAIK